MQQRFFSKTGVCLWVAATFGALAVIPYVNALTPHALEQAAKQHGLPIWALAVMSILQSAMMAGVLSFSGLWAARKLGLGAPLLDAWLEGAPAPQGLRRIVLSSIALGLASGMALVVLDTFLFLPLSPHDLGRVAAQPQPSPWIGFLASFGGGFTEEVELRLFLLSFLALGINQLIGLLKQTKGLSLSSTTFWSANIIAAIMFGLGHLPMTSQLMPLTPVIVVRALVLNGIVGLIAGYLFWRRGIEMAMLCHFSADIILHVVLRPLLPALVKFSG